MKIIWITVLCLASTLRLPIQQHQPWWDSWFYVAAQQPSSPHRLADSLQRKLDHIQANGRVAHPDQTPTVMTDEEINDYLAAGRVKLPLGVKNVIFQWQPGMITALATIDFDAIRAGQRSSNPLLSVFTGIHDVRVESDASGSGGLGKVHVRTVSIDGIEVPRIALEFFLSRYITPKYPNVGMDSVFRLPYRIDLAIVGYHKLTVTQK
jgi:hypothetical protein